MMDRTLSESLKTSLVRKAPNLQVDLWLAHQKGGWAGGKNEETEALYRLGLIEGIIDDHAKIGSHWKDIPLVRMNTVDVDTTVINCSTAIAPVDVNLALLKNGLVHSIDLSDLLSHPDCPIAQPWFVQQQRKLLDHQASKLDQLFNRMSDVRSKKTLLDVMRFRLSANADYMKSYSVRFQSQYLEDFLHLNNEVFVDAGAYDGDTTQAFCSYCPSFQSVHLYEPSEINMKAAKQRLKKLNNIYYHALGLSNKPGTLRFDAEAGSASSITQSGSDAIDVCRLDDDLQEIPTFIKMDLEGWELHALEGCANHIRTSQPKLAISVYHQGSHFLDVPELISQYFDGYSLYMRHYTQGWSETVMFFIKNK